MSSPLLTPLKPSGKTHEYPCDKLCALCGEVCTDDRPIVGIEIWNGIKNHARNWIGLDKFGDVYDRVDWEKPQKLHENCRKTISASRQLKQAQVRFQKRVLENEQNESTIEDVNAEAPNEPKRVLRSTLGPLHEKHLCVWCMLPEDSKHKGRKSGTKRPRAILHCIQQQKTWNMFKMHTVYLEDPLMRSRINSLIETTPDPFANEIRYHHSCWMKYVQSRNSADAIHLQDVTRDEVKRMFIGHVHKVIIEMNEPRSLQGLLTDYIELHSNFGYDVKNTRTSTIKEIIGSQPEMKTVHFHSRFQRNKSDIVYNSEVGGSFIEAALNFWGIDDNSLVNAAARRIKSSLSNDTNIPWPPHVNVLETSDAGNELLENFLAWLRDPTADPTKCTLSNQARALVSFLTAYVTRKRTATQAMLSVTVHGITRCKEIVEILHKLGCGVSYNDVLELYNAWAKHEIDNDFDSLRELSNGKPGVAITDNDDFRDDTLTGAGTSHRTNLMWVQSEKNLSLLPAETDTENVAIDRPQKGELESYAMNLHKVNPYKTSISGRPEIRPAIDISLPTTTDQRVRSTIHALARLDPELGNVNPAEQTVGAFTGFQAHIQPAEVKSKAYYDLTLKDPPNKATVNEIMTRVRSVAERKDMPFVILCGDQPVYSLISQLKSENPVEFAKIVPFLGPFHLQCSFMVCIYKRFSGSGLEDILVAADLVVEGSVEQALRAKKYKRGIRCYTLLYECLLRRLITKTGIECPTEITDKIELLKNGDSDELIKVWSALENSDAMQKFADNIFREVRRSKSQTDEFWLTFMEMVELLMENIYSIRTHNWLLFLETLRKMMPWLTIYDQSKYGKWLPAFWLDMKSLPSEISAAMPSLFSHSITGKPFTSLPLDLWIEMTMNKGSKMKAGWMNILKNEKMLMIHSMNVNHVNKVRQSLHTSVNLKRTASDHRENSKKRRKVDEQAVQDLNACLEEYECDVMCGLNSLLHSLQSGKLADESLINDFRTAHADGEKLLERFFSERLFSTTTPWTKTISLNKRRNFSKPVKSETKSSDSKIRSALMETKAMNQVVTMLESSDDKISLEDILEHRVTEECLSIFNPNGSMYKCQKSKLLECMKFQEVPAPNAYTALIDMGLYWRIATPTPEDRHKPDGTTYSWADYAAKIFNVAKSRHPFASCYIFVNDYYEMQYGIKDAERILRANTKNASYSGLSKNVYIKPEDPFPPSREFSEFLHNDKNKVRLQLFLKDEFIKLVASQLEKSFIFSLRETCWDLHTGLNIYAYQCFQSEADTILFYIYHKLRESGEMRPVVVDSEDTDVVVLAAHVSQKEPGDLILRHKRAFCDAKKLFPADVASFIVKFHIFTGTDSVSGFFGQSKKTIYTRALKNKSFVKLASLGESLECRSGYEASLCGFVIQNVYGDNTSRKMSQARARKWRTMKKKCTKRLPPDYETLTHHINRANYQCYTMLNYSDSDPLPDPLGNGWILVDGKCLPLRNSSSALPHKFSAMKSQEMAYSSDEESSKNENENDSDSDSLSELDSDD